MTSGQSRWTPAAPSVCSQVPLIRHHGHNGKDTEVHNGGGKKHGVIHELNSTIMCSNMNGNTNGHPFSFFRFQSLSFKCLFVLFFSKMSGWVSVLINRGMNIDFFRVMLQRKKALQYSLVKFINHRSYSRYFIWLAVDYTNDHTH